MSAGYDIGVSGSTANSTPQGTQAATVFNFNSPGASFEGGSQSLEAPATAVATTKSPGAQSSVSPGQNPNSRNPEVSGNLFPSFAAPGEAAMYGLIAAAAILGAVLLFKR